MKLLLQLWKIVHQRPCRLRKNNNLKSNEEVIRIIPYIIANPDVLSEDKVIELSMDIVKDFEDKGATYHEAHKILEEHIKVFKKALNELGHNALYAFGDKPVKFLLDS